MTNEPPTEPTWEAPTAPYTPVAAYAPAPMPAAVAPRRSAWVTTTAVILLAIGALTGLFSLIMVLVGVVLGSAMGDLMSMSVQSGIAGPGSPDEATIEAASGMMTGFLVAFAVIGIIWAAAHVAAGIGILGGRGWARITGMVLSIIGLVFSVLGLVAMVASIGMTSAMLEDPTLRDMYGSELTPEMMTSGLVVNVLLIAPFAIGYVIALVTLIRSGAYFDRRSSQLA